MKSVRVIPIVEGHGEVVAIRTLLDRTWREIIRGEWIDVLTPIRRPRNKLLRPGRGGASSQPNAEEIAHAVRLGTMKLAAKSQPEVAELILLLLDADEDCPRELAPQIMIAARDAAGSCQTAVVLAKEEYETWFVAAAASLARHLNLTEEPPALPEQQRCGKAWISQRIRASRYSETVDQVRLTAEMDLHMCRQRSPSFDKLCRVFEELEAGPLDNADGLSL